MPPQPSGLLDALPLTRAEKLAMVPPVYTIELPTLDDEAALRLISPGGVYVPFYGCPEGETLDDYITRVAHRYEGYRFYSVEDLNPEAIRGLDFSVAAVNVPTRDLPVFSQAAVRNPVVVARHLANAQAHASGETRLVDMRNTSPSHAVDFYDLAAHVWGVDIRVRFTSDEIALLHGGVHPLVIEQRRLRDAEPVDVNELTQRQWRAPVPARQQRRGPLRRVSSQQRYRDSSLGQQELRELKTQQELVENTIDTSRPISIGDRTMRIDWHTTRVWTTASNKRIPIRDMDDEHLFNTIRWAVREVKKLYVHYGGPPAAREAEAKNWLARQRLFRALVREAVRRDFTFDPAVFAFIDAFVLPSLEDTKSEDRPWKRNKLKKRQKKKLKKLLEVPQAAEDGRPLRRMRITDNDAKED